MNESCKHELLMNESPYLLNFELWFGLNDVECLKADYVFLIMLLNRDIQRLVLIPCIEGKIMIK